MNHMGDKDTEKKDVIPEDDELDEGQDGTDGESDAEAADGEAGEDGDGIDVDLDDEDETDGEEDDADGSEDADEGDDESDDSDEEGEDESDDSDEEGEDDDADEGGKGPGKKLSAIAQKKKWRERALAAEAKLRGNGDAKNPSGKANQKPNESKKRVGNDSVLINFRLDHPTLKSQEVAEIEAYAKARGVSLEKALKSDVIRIMIARNRKRQQQQGGSISPSRRGQPTKPEKDWSRAGRDEMEKEAARRRALSRQAKR